MLFRAGSCSASPVGDLVSDLVMRGARLAADEVALILGVQDGRVDGLAGESVDRVDAVPERQGDELRGAVVVAPEQPGSAVAGGAAVCREAGFADVRGILLGVGGAHGAAPGAGDHRSIPVRVVEGSSARVVEGSSTMGARSELTTSAGLIRMQLRPRSAADLIAVCQRPRNAPGLCETAAIANRAVGRPLGI